MRNKINQIRVLSVLNAGLLLGSLVSTNLMAAECGQAKLIESGSAGAVVTQNTCKDDPSRLSLGSVVNLSSGSRMWLKFDPSGKEISQLICQNKSATAVNVAIVSTHVPWIKPQGLKNCEQWLNNKLSCDSQEGEKNSFFCAIATAKAVRTSSVPENTTSVKLRDPFAKSLVITPAMSDEEIIESIKPDVELCKRLYNVAEKVEMSWTVYLGKIQNLNVNSENQELVTCVDGVVKQANANQDRSLKYSF